MPMADIAGEIRAFFPHGSPPLVYNSPWARTSARFEIEHRVQSGHGFVVVDHDLNLVGSGLPTSQGVVVDDLRRQLEIHAACSSEDLNTIQFHNCAVVGQE